jgi:glycosyltransferase involved in cell wall biosynthesis
VVIAAASPWSRQPDSTAGVSVPANVVVSRFSQYDLRRLYADSQFMVMPLQAVDFQAGVTAILEALAMSRPVVCTRTAGQQDVIVEGETGLYVPPGEPLALRQAIIWMLGHPAEARAMGANGRRLIEERMSLEAYVQGLAASVSELLAEGPQAGARPAVAAVAAEDG